MDFLLKFHELKIPSADDDYLDTDPSAIKRLEEAHEYIFYILPLFKICSLWYYCLNRREHLLKTKTKHWYKLKQEKLGF